MNEHGQPIGSPVPDWRGAKPPAREAIQGAHCRLEPLDADRHAAALFRAYAADAGGRNWTYLPYGPFATLADYQGWLAEKQASRDECFFAIVDPQRDQPVGVAAYLRIAPQTGSIEVGHLSYSPALQRTRRFDRGDVPDDEAGLRRLGLPPLRVEMRRPERAVPSGRHAPRLPLRGRLPQADGHEGAQSRHRLVLDRRRRVARNPHGASRPGSLRRTSTQTAVSVAVSRSSCRRRRASRSSWPRRPDGRATARRPVRLICRATDSCLTRSVRVTALDERLERPSEAVEIRRSARPG